MNVWRDLARKKRLARVGKGKGRGGGGGNVPPPADVTAPTITSANSANNAEGDVLAHALTANESVTWSIVGGADQARFELSGSTLRWASNGVKDFETPDDADTNNTYVVQVRATDAASNFTNQTVTITVTDVVVELVAPEIEWTSSSSVAVPTWAFIFDDPQVGDIITLRRATNVGMSVGVTEYTDTIDSIGPPNELDFATGDWADGTWFVDAMVTRGVDSSARSTPPDEILIDTVGVVGDFFAARYFAPRYFAPRYFG